MRINLDEIENWIDEAHTAGQDILVIDLEFVQSWVNQCREDARAYITLFGEMQECKCRT